MPVYGDPDHVEKILRAETDFDLGPDVHDRLVSIQASMSLQLEQKCKRTWGVPAADQTAIYWIGDVDTIILDRPARAVTSVTTGGETAGSTYSGGTVVDGSEYTFRPVGAFDGLIRGIVRLNGVPWTIDAAQYDGIGRVPVKVVAQFADVDADDAVPADVDYAVNVLILETFKAETASPAGFTGPDGGTVPIRDPWKHPTVKQVIEQYKPQRRWVV